ncbi:hypothetical protein AA13594_1880 [Gluconacetobacter azotocaptans DSM 13594]|nr:DUF1330 domain-containing protein [Gluconacetobacter azotocaptans]GBQ30851.1 hypothetical protein AA13594_1880 [Gluconacetobacter azotocaptans DSM 13594]
MATYVISERHDEVTDEAAFATYREVTGRMVKRHGGVYLTVSRDASLLEGDKPPLVVGIIRFPSLEHVRAWWDSPEYQAIAPLRRTVPMRVYAVSGTIPSHAVTDDHVKEDV